MEYATWNIWTLMENPNSDLLEQRTALMAREPAQFDIDIVALSETRYSEEGQYTQDVGGYTFFWKGKAKKEWNIHGIRFSIPTRVIT